MTKPKQVKVHVAEVFYPQFFGHEMVLFQHGGTHSMTRTFAFYSGSFPSMFKSNPLLGGSYHFDPFRDLRFYWRCYAAFCGPFKKSCPRSPIFPHLCILLRPCVIHVYSDQSSAQQTGSDGSGCQPEDRSSYYFGKKCCILLYLLMGSDRWYSSMDNLSLFVGTLRFLRVLHLNGKGPAPQPSWDRWSMELSYLHRLRLVWKDVQRCMTFGILVYSSYSRFLLFYY